MNRKLIEYDVSTLPSAFQSFLTDAKLYDSSCSEMARVLYIEKDDGYFLKISPSGTLSAEAKMAEYFSKLGLTKAPIKYVSSDNDYLLTERIRGEDCTHSLYLENPKRLCDTIAERLYELHNAKTEGCPVQNRMNEYFRTVEENYGKGIFDPTFLLDDFVVFVLSIAIIDAQLEKSSPQPAVVCIHFLNSIVHCPKSHLLAV